MTTSCSHEYSAEFARAGAAETAVLVATGRLLQRSIECLIEVTRTLRWTCWSRCCKVRRSLLRLSADCVLKMRCSKLQEQYLEFSTVIPASSALYGLGERSSSTGIELRRDGIPLALWNHDSPAAAPDQNVYGSHPILMEVREGEASVLGADLCLCCCLWSLPAFLQRLAMVRVRSLPCLEWATQTLGFFVCCQLFPALHWLFPALQNAFAAVQCPCLTRAQPAFDCDPSGVLRRQHDARLCAAEQQRQGCVC